MKRFWGLLAPESRWLAETVFLLGIAIALYWQSTWALPRALHGFEYWVDAWLPVLDKSWKDIYWTFFSQFGDNEANASVSSPIWVAIIALGKNIFEDPMLAHRVPSALLTLLAPIILADIVR